MSNIIQIAAVFCVDMRADQIVVVNSVNVVLKDVKLRVAFARCSGERIVYSVGPVKLGILRAHVSLVYQILVANIGIRSSINRVIAAVAVGAFERRLGMSRRYPDVAIDAGPPQKRVRSDLR